MSNENIGLEIVGPLAKIYENTIKQTDSIIKCDSISINFWQMELKSLLDNEPLYLFKKKHQEWEEKVKDTKEHLEYLYKSQIETTKDLIDLKFNSP